MCVPTAKLLVLQVAVLTLALPVGSATAAQPEIELPPSVKLMLPVGALPVTVAVKVMFAPTVDGLSELASDVVVATRLVEVSVTLSMKVVLSLGSVPVKVSVCAPVVATENGMLTAVKLVLAGDTRLPIWVPSTVTLIGCGTPQRDEAWNASV